MSLPARIGLLTLACRDVDRMTQLFRALGWQETPDSDEHHRTFQCTNGIVVALYDARHYEPEFGPPSGGFRGTVLSTHVSSFEECVAIHQSMQAVEGVELLEEPTQAPWGGGFTWRDPEGNLWDVVWVKDAKLDEHGGVFFP
jgi:predicted lactoylglutathione lyase